MANKSREFAIGVEVNGYSTDQVEGITLDDFVRLLNSNGVYGSDKIYLSFSNGYSFGSLNVSDNKIKEIR